MQNKHRRNKASRFIPNLHKILQEKQSGAYWTEDGKSFVLNDISKLISNSLVKYFRHSSITSFIRQLNLYGFKKLVGEQYEENTYFHKSFRKNQITELKPIKSFYNKSRYGNVKKLKTTKGSRTGVQSLRSNKEEQNFSNIDDIQNFDSDSSLKNLKQKIASLESENQRLRSIEVQYIRLQNFMNSCGKGFCFNDQSYDARNYNLPNLVSSEKETAIVYYQGIDSYKHPIMHTQTQQEQFFYYQMNPYNMAFQRMF